MAADFRYKLLAVESGMFLAVQMLALFVASTLLKKGMAPEPMESTSMALVNIGIAFAIAMGIIVTVLYFLKTPKTFGAFFAFMIFIGTVIVFETFFPDIIAIPLTIAVIAFRFWKPNIITHNIAIFLTIAGVSVQLGLVMPSVLAVIIILLALSVYDYLAVFKFKTMVKMFQQMLQRGAPFAIIVPESVEHLGEHVGKVSKEKLRQSKGQQKIDSQKPKYMMLGTGDLAFPAVFAVSAMHLVSIWAALAIIAGAMIGLVVNHYYLTRKFQAIPALPALAVFSILGYVLSQLPGWI